MSITNKNVRASTVSVRGPAARVLKFVREPRVGSGVGLGWRVGVGRKRDMVDRVLGSYGHTQSVEAVVMEEENRVVRDDGPTHVASEEVSLEMD